MSDEKMRWGSGLRTIALSVLFGMGSLAGMPAGANTVTCRVELDRSVLPADAAQRAIIKITLDAPPPPKQNRPPVNLALVLDRSGSMGGAKLGKAKEAAIEVLRRLEARDIFSLVVYDTQVETLVPAQSAGNAEWIEARIREIRPGNSTALFGGVSQGAAEIRKNLNRKYVHRIILLSDGLANVGPSTPEDLGRLGVALIKEGIAVTTVGVGTDYNEDLMARLSQNSDGSTYFVENSRDLPRIFKAEMGDVLSVVAKKVTLVIECPEGVRPVSVIGREGRIRGQTVELFLNQLYGGQEKYVLVEVDIPPGKHGASRDIAVARVTYDNPFTASHESSSGTVRGRYSNERKEVDESANAPVQKAYFINLHALAQEQAIVLADDGKKEEAAKKLREAGDKLKKAGALLRDKELDQKGDESKKQSEEISEEGMSRMTRKIMRSESYQEINQQHNR